MGTRSINLLVIALGSLAVAVATGGSLASLGHSAPILPAEVDANNVPQSPSGKKVTFNRDIAPIVFKNCASCHRPGEAGPFPLLTYDEVKKHGRMIVAVTQQRYMPPWLPDPQPLEFYGKRRLSAEQIALIRKWVDQGMLQGNPADLPPPPQFVAGWQLGQPDLIVKATKPYLVPAAGTDMYWNFVLPVPIKEARWVKAVEVLPGDKQLVHHANVVVDRLGLLRIEEKESSGGFGGPDVMIAQRMVDRNNTHFLLWKPGTVPYVEPDGMAFRLDPGADLVLNSHLQPSGKPELIQPSIGIYFTDKPATKHPILFMMQCDELLSIPPGDPNYVVTSRFVLPFDVDLLAIYPHAHHLGKDLKATATLPGGASEMLIHIRHWDLNWQAVYRYLKPVPLPKGTTISLRYVYDNTDDNVANPNHPPQLVQAGNRTRDEMAHLAFQVLPKNFLPSNGDPREVLERALMQSEACSNTPVARMR